MNTKIQIPQGWGFEPPPQALHVSNKKFKKNRRLWIYLSWRRRLESSFFLFLAFDYFSSSILLFGTSTELLMFEFKIEWCEIDSGDVEGMKVPLSERI